MGDEYFMISCRMHRSIEDTSQPNENSQIHYLTKSLKHEIPVLPSLIKSDFPFRKIVTPPILKNAA